MIHIFKKALPNPASPYCQFFRKATVSRSFFWVHKRIISITSSFFWFSYCVGYLPFVPWIYSLLFSGQRNSPVYEWALPLSVGFVLQLGESGTSEGGTLRLLSVPWAGRTRADSAVQPGQRLAGSSPALEAGASVQISDR